MGKGCEHPRRGPALEPHSAHLSSPRGLPRGDGCWGVTVGRGCCRGRVVTAADRALLTGLWPGKGHRGTHAQ